MAQLPHGEMNGGYSRQTKDEEQVPKKVWTLNSEDSNLLLFYCIIFYLFFWPPLRKKRDFIRVIIRVIEL